MLSAYEAKEIKFFIKIIVKQMQFFSVTKTGIMSDRPDKITLWFTCR